MSFKLFVAQNFKYYNKMILLIKILEAENVNHLDFPFKFYISTAALKVKWCLEGEPFF